MKLNTRTRYAVMALVDLAALPPGTCASLKEMASRQQLSISYLEQLFSVLRRANILVSVRGVTGGYKLALPADEISVASVVQALDDPIAITRCRSKGQAGQGCLKAGAICKVHHLWADLEDRIWAYLSEVSLADVASGRFAEGRALGDIKPLGFDGQVRQAL